MPARTTPTWLDPEEVCYPSGRQLRKGKALICKNRHYRDIPGLPIPYGQVRSVRAGVPDTFFTIPAYILVTGFRVQGFLSLSNAIAAGQDTPNWEWRPNGTPNQP